MRKILSFVVMCFGLVLPLTVNAASEITYSCGDFDENGVRTCKVSYVIDESTPQNSITVNLTEHGGATITSIEDIEGAEFYMPTEAVQGDGMWTATLQTLDAVYGEFDLLTFKYQKSGTEDCKVTISIGDTNKEVDEPMPESPETGSTLPYIALGAIALIAVGAYLKTKNKAKMYRI